MECLKLEILIQASFKITFPNTVGRMIFSKICTEFQKQYPHFQLELIFTANYLDLIEDDIDIAFRSWDVLPNSQLYAIELLKTSPIFVASKQYITEHGQPNSLEELQQHNVLLTQHDKLEDSWITNNKHYRFKGNLICNNRFHIREDVLAGNGIAMLPSYFCQRDLNAGTMIEVLSNLERNQKHVGAVYKVKRQSSRKIDVFLTYVQDKINELTFA